MLKNKITLSGNNLSPEQIKSFIVQENLQIEIDPTALDRVRRSFEFLQSRIKDEVIYGVNTGFGPMASRVIGHEELAELQINLIRSHAAGMGDPLPPDFVLATMLVRLNTLLKGYSGVSHELVEHFALLINHRVIPVIPDHGAVGTSGDLVQLAHIASVFLGEGQVLRDGEVFPAKEILSELGIPSYVLKPKEGLSLINGTSVMSGIGSLLLLDAENILSLAVKAGAWGMELVAAYEDSVDDLVSSVRAHPGQKRIASLLRGYLSGSRRTRSRKDMDHSVPADHVLELDHAIQEVYSLRCIAQILGPVSETLSRSRSDIQIEINSVTDNPIVDVEAKRFVHAGNFHGDYVSAALDYMKISLTKLILLSERRINFFLNNKVNQFLSPFLNLKTPGLTLALQGLQFVATSTTARSQTIAYPQHIHSISTNGDNQDVVSMGTDAALLAAQTVSHAYTLLAIELFVLAQAVDCLKAEDQLSPASQSLYRNIRKEFPSVIEDRPLSQEMNRFVALLREGFLGE